jgi:hypothetical protein
VIVVNREHLKAFLWLRWRLLVHQVQRGGIVNVVILAIVAGGAVLLAAGLFVGFFLAGLFLLDDVSPQILLYVWDGLVFVLLLWWSVGLMVDLQRSEVLSLDKFLHLPVSLSGAFLINYVSSLLSVSLVLVVPPMLALALALAIVKGPAMLLVLPLLAAFLLMVTGVTYQFQGWLASLMTNQRRRRTVIVVVTMAFVLLFQLPNLLNIMRPWKGGHEDDFAAQMLQRQVELQREVVEHKLTPEEYKERRAELDREKKDHDKEASARDARQLEQLEQGFWLVNLVLPPGWLPLGAAACAEGQVGYALLCVLGMGAIGTFSLWRAYRTTMRLYTGQVDTGKKTAAAPAPAPAPEAGRQPVGNFLERALPWVSEQASAIALGGFRSLVRAPESKMMLLTPVIMVLVFGSAFFTRSAEVPEMARPLVVFGTMSVILLSMGQLIGNQFGMDRGGFRVFVLTAAPRRDILLGKNLACAPLVLGLALPVLVLVQLLQPMRLEHFLALLPQMVAMYLLYCLVANCQSILAPMAIRPGSFKPVNTKATPVLIHMAFGLLSPLTYLPVLLPLGIEFGLEQLNWAHGVPVCLLLSVLVCAGAVGVYRLVLPWEGRLLQAREKKILELVTTKAE